jgi:IS5 family transposase
MLFYHYDLDNLVAWDHPLRKCKERLLVKEAAEERERWKKSLGREGYGAETGLRALFLQFWGNHSDREMEDQLRHNNAYRWFCDFSLESETPDHTFFCRMRKAMGPENVLVMFNKMVEDAQLRKILKRFESFVDASAIRRKEAEWAERDRKREEEEQELQEQAKHWRKEHAKEQAAEKKKAEGGANSAERIKQFSADTEARWGCKRNAENGRPAKYWFGYKRHVCVDTSSGMIEKIAVTPANVNDSNAFRLVCPWGKRILADRGYDTFEVRGIMKQKGCIDRVMKLSRRKDFNAQRNKDLSRRRSPWEMVFAHMDKRTRYMGLKKTYLQAIMEAIVFNLKRLVLLEGVNPPVIGLA